MTASAGTAVGPAVRAAVALPADWADTAQLVAEDAELNLVGRSENHVGDVSGFAPPGDIHRVRNISDTTAISMHIYGTDITRIGSSARRYYD